MVEPLQLQRGLFAANAPVDHLDHDIWKFYPKVRQQPLRIGSDASFARRGRRADRDHLDLSVLQAAGKIGQRLLERCGLDRKL